MFDGHTQSSTILAALRSDHDFRSLRQVVPTRRTRLLRSATLAETRRFLERSHVDVVVTDVGLADGLGWKDVLEATRMSSRPRPMIVASHSADEFLWAEVLNLGGFDVLNQPFEQEEVLWVLAAALRDGDRGRAALQKRPCTSANAWGEREYMPCRQEGA